MLLLPGPPAALFERLKLRVAASWGVARGARLSRLYRPRGLIGLRLDAHLLVFERAQLSSAFDLREPVSAFICFSMSAAFSMLA
jgi:hypothetical protein